MILKECIMTNSTCYKQSTSSKKTGIVVHSTGANNKYIRRYVQPLKSYPDYDKIIADLGRNPYGNDWNHVTRYAGVHAFIGYNAANVVETYKVLPYEKDAWGVGRGTWIYANSPYFSDITCKNEVGRTSEGFMGDQNFSSNGCVSFAESGLHYYVPYKYCGSYNFSPNSRIQFEICEDALDDEAYFGAVMREAQEYCAYLCGLFGWSVDKISSHAESVREGFGQGHGDPDHWLSKFGRNMDWFRASVETLLNGVTPEPEPEADVHVGDVVDFVGDVHYSNSYAEVGLPCRPGKAIVTLVNAGTPHPYHLIAAKGGTSDVYGFVDADTVVVQPEEIFAVGDLVRIKPTADRYYSGKIIPAWVKKSDLYVRAVERGGEVLLLSVEPELPVYTGRVKASDVYMI